MSNLQQQLLLYREKNKITQQELADLLNVKRSALSHWEMGKITPRPEVLKRISQLLNISVDLLIDNETEQNTEEIKFAFYNQQGIVTEEQKKEVENFIAFIKERDKNDK